MKDILHLNMYLITNLLTVYTVYKFFKIFFDEERYQKYKIPVDISLILGNLITVIVDYQIPHKPLKILSL